MRPGELKPSCAFLGIRESDQDPVGIAKVVTERSGVPIRCVRANRRRVRPSRTRQRTLSRRSEDLARLDHPHILTLIDSGNAGGLLYYVLPFVRGESLRDLLDREQQLGIEQALAITKHIASALDYAHRKGTIHRDITPENILLQEGEAMLADFGIAVAVQESGGSRLTETGLSLGTPYYLSPEQATGERTLDARSDLYSSAAVLYEMLVGEPPITGKTTHAVIAKLLTEKAMHVRTVRDTVPVHIDEAIAKSLSKVPADRYATVADFSRALDTPTTIAAAAGALSSAATAKSGRNKVMIGAVAAAVLPSAVGALASKGAFTKTDTSATLRQRSQLTFTRKVSSPTLSPDGKQLAYFTRECDGANCTYAIDVQDVGNTNTRRVYAGATAASFLAWSPDRRNLLMNGTINGKYGTFIASALGGTPRFLTSGAAGFYAGGDSLLIGAGLPSDSGFVVRIAGLDGSLRDSIMVPGVGVELNSLVAIPGTTRFVSSTIQEGRGFWQVLNRDGTVTDHLLNTCTCGAAASHDALWMARAGATAAEAIVRVALDPSTGKFSAHQDTIYSGRFSNLSVTADGAQMAVDDGTTAFSAFAGELKDFMGGVISDAAPLLQASTSVGAAVSPDGARLLIRRNVPVQNGGDEVRFAIKPFGGGDETPLNLSGRLSAAKWVDSVTIQVVSLTPTSTHVVRADVRTGAVSAPLDIPGDVPPSSITALPYGWAWVPAKGDRVVVEQNGKRHDIVKSPWFENFIQVDASPDGLQLAIVGWGASTRDTLRLDVVPVLGGTAVPWSRHFAEIGNSSWVSDGTLAFLMWPTTTAVSVLHVTAPGQEKNLGTVRHVARAMSVSRDLKRATIMAREIRADAWMFRVVKP